MQGYRRALTVLAVVVVAIVVAVTTASAHIERASYWPDPAPDTSGTPAAGGGVPKARSLFSALRKAPPGRTRVVCHGKRSLRRLNRSVKRARRSGWSVRPSQPTRPLSKSAARRLGLRSSLLAAIR